MFIRFATKNDSADLLKIYAQYIDTPITFECVLPTVEEFYGRIASIADEYPYLVCEDEGKVIGYAYAHRHMEREAYKWNAELSIYLDQAFTSKGLGQKLYRILFAILKLQGIKTLYTGVTVPNEKSEKLHKSLGFKKVGTYYNTGYKSGKWHDVLWLEKNISPYCDEPMPFLPIVKVSRKEINSIIENAV